MSPLNTLCDASGATQVEKEMDRYWNSVVTEEPIPDDLRPLIRANLIDWWHFHRDAEYRKNMVSQWQGTDSGKIVIGSRVPDLNRTEFQWMCNKATAFYWQQSAQYKDMVNVGVFRAIFEEWVRCHKVKPDIDNGHFFATPMRITSTGPSRIQDIVTSHVALCEQARGIWSDRPKYSFHPLYSSVLVIIDGLYPTSEIHAVNGIYSTHEFAQKQSVLVVRIGLDQGLSAPISLEDLRAHSLPLQRPDVVTTDAEFDIVRVSLDVAVRFIVGLEQREDEGRPRERTEDYVDLSICPECPGFLASRFEAAAKTCSSPELWADAVMTDAGARGFDNVIEADTAIRQAQASLVGQVYCALIHEPFSGGRHWRY